MKKNSTTRSGFTLLGVMVSAFFAIVVIVALASMISQIFGMSRLSKNRFVAVGLAKEGIELVRNMRDSNWLNYPNATDLAPVTKMKWRGDATDTSCSLGDACQRLRSICNGTWTMDALDTDLIQKTTTERPPLLRESSGSQTGVYTHGAGTNPIFSRTITIGTEADYSGSMSSGACGEEINFLDPTQTKPLGVIVTSTVTWKEPGTGADKSVELTSTLYDWVTTRP